MGRRKKQLDPTTSYAQRVVDGEIVAGKYVRLACRRHLDDLKSGAKRGLRFDVDAAQDAIDFFPSVLTIADGPLAGEPFHLLEWHTFVVGSLFGWFQNGRLRFRSAWLEAAKGSAKSPLMGGIALYVCGFMGIPRAQCYAFAAKLDQARIPFKDAVALVRGPIPGEGLSLEKRGDVFVSGRGENAWRIEFVADGSFFEAKATTDTLSGPRPSCVIGDEIHETANDKAIEIWEAGIAKMSGVALMILATNTPASDQVVCLERSERLQRMLEGAFESDSEFAFIARVDAEDKPFKDETCWAKAMPALGVTFDHRNVRSEVEKAANSPSKHLSVSRLYFGMPVGSSTPWVDEDKWRRCIRKIGNIEGMKCHLALDLSEKNDLTALAGAWVDDEDRVSAKVWYWTTKDGLRRRSRQDRIEYSNYVESGELSVVDDPVIDYEFVAMQVKRLAAEHDVDSLTVDPAFLEKFVTACEKVGLAVWVYQGPEKPEGQGLKIVRHSQGTKIAFGERNLCMPHSITRLTDKVLAGGIAIEGNRLTQYCAANATLKTDAMGNAMFVKPRQMGRIDGIVAIAMAVGASEGTKAEAAPSYQILVF